ncbi:hypothetical protein Ciccas_008073 [Cichlidogyrus casuarinus]|uniref:Aminopeptidase N n=1 Tax=Cichlidogyrus casuarinus TaxID=1844966 RepID=A0ABD2Q103_9PLAT
MENYTALTNMEKIASRNLGQGRVEDSFKQTPTMSTYLMAFVVSQLSHKESRKNNKWIFRVWAIPDQIEQANFALEIGPGMLSRFEEYFQVDYPLAKLDMVAVPQFTHGAMENWGLIIYRQETMLFDPKEHKFDRADKVAKVIGHEIAHQWFGNLVTMNWWEELWLNEGMTSFIEELGTMTVKPDWYEENKPINEQAPLNTDTSNDVKPLFNPIKKNETIAEMFNEVSYNKGAQIARMMEGFLGEKLFRQGLIRYMKKNAYKNTRDSDLFEALQAEFEKTGQRLNVSQVMESWIRSPGIPLVSIRSTSRRNVFELRQKRLLRPDMPKSDVK